MSFIHRRRRRDSKKRYDVLADIINNLEGYSRLQKIEALVSVGIPISRKCDKNRVDKKVKDSYEKATQEYLSIYEERIEANRRRRMRKQRQRQRNLQK
jgi:hypothetical protein